MPKSANFVRALHGSGLGIHRFVSPKTWLQMERLEERELPATSWAFDLGTAGSPVATGFTSVTPVLYDAARHFGWQSLSGITAVARTGSDALRSDFHSGTVGTFLVDVPNGTYDVSVTLGDSAAMQWGIAVWAEGELSVWGKGQLLARSVTTLPGAFRQVRGRVTVTDGQLDLHLKGPTGLAPTKFALDGLTISPVNTAATGLFNSADLPQVTSFNDATPAELGVRFKSAVDGFVTGIRYYKGAQNAGPHTGSLWAADGALLATATFTSETASGWQQVTFSRPVAIKANTTYVASYHTNGFYAIDPDYFALSGKANGLLYAPSSPEASGNGVFRWGTSGFPNQNSQGSNFWVDVVFQQNDTVSPTVLSVTPANGSTAVGLSTQVQVRFSKAMNSATINDATVDLIASDGSVVPAAVTYNPATTTALITLFDPLSAATTYSVVVRGGTNSPRVKDLAGNSLATDFISTFTTTGSGIRPTANAGADKVADEGTAVAFQGTSTGLGALSYSWSYGDGTSATGTLTPSHTYADNGTYTVALTVTDSAGQRATDSAIVIVRNVAPTATLSNNGPVQVGNPVTITFASPSDRSPADTAAGFKYSYDFNNDGTFDLTDVTAASASTTFATAGTHVVRGRITDKDGGVTDYATTVSTIDTNGGTYLGLTIPVTHTRIWFTPERLAQARQYFATHPFTPRADDPQGNALRYLMTGEVAYAQNAINSLMAFTISDAELAGTASDHYRWADWVPVVFDWVYDQMTSSQRSTFIDRYNNYTNILIQKPWGGPGMEANNYYWGYWRNEFNWAIATYYENTARAQRFLDDALVRRWQNSFLPWANNRGVGGVPQEGTQYGRYMLQYVVVPLETSALMGRNLLNETNFYKEAAYNLIYSTSPTPVANKTGARVYYQVFPSNDDEKSYGFPAANDPYYADFMTLVAGNLAGTRLAGQIRQWLTNVGANPSWYLAATTNLGQPISLTELPLDYYAPGPAFLYTKGDWQGSAASILFQLGTLSGVGHRHLDSGSFQILSNGQWLSKETTGYASSITGYSGSGSVAVDSTLSTNGLIVGGLGLAHAYADGPSVVTRLQSTADYTFASVDLSQAFRAHASNYPDRDDNPYVQHVVRDFVYVRSLNTLLVFDRIESSSERLPAPTVDKTFLLHFNNVPTIQGPNTILGVNGNEALRVTTLLPAGQSAPTYRIVDERTGTLVSDTDYQYRLEETTRGQAQSYLINVLQARDVAASDVVATLTENANSFTITLVHPTRGTAVIQMAKGMASTGGSFAFSPAGPPTSSTPLTNGVESIHVTENGVVWG